MKILAKHRLCCDAGLVLPHLKLTTPVPCYFKDDWQQILTERAAVNIWLYWAGDAEIDALWRVSDVSAVYSVEQVLDLGLFSIINKDENEVYKIFYTEKLKAFLLGFSIHWQMLAC